MAPAPAKYPGYGQLRLRNPGSGRPVQFSALTMEIVRNNNLPLTGMTQGSGRTVQISALRMKIARYNFTLIGMIIGFRSGRLVPLRMEIERFSLTLIGMTKEFWQTCADLFS